MDFGIKGKWAIVCAASKGLGYGCARSLAGEGVNLVINARTAATLEAAAERIRAETGVEVITVATDITKEDGRRQVLAAAPQVDILINNAGGPPPGNFRKFTRDDWIAALDANMLTPIELIKSTVDLMISRKFGRVVNITSSAVKAPMGPRPHRRPPAPRRPPRPARPTGLPGPTPPVARATCATPPRPPPRSPPSRWP